MPCLSRCGTIIICLQISIMDYANRNFYYAANAIFAKLVVWPLMRYDTSASCAEMCTGAIVWLGTMCAAD